MEINFDTNGVNVHEKELSGENMLADLVYSGLLNELVHVVKNPNDDKIACKIGEHWFYFLDPMYENFTMQKFFETFSTEEIVTMITKALLDMKKDGFLNEVNYYEAILLKPYLDELANMV